MIVEAKYEIDGWIRYEKWDGTSHALKNRAREKMRHGAYSITLSLPDGSTLFHLQSTRMHP